MCIGTILSLQQDFSGWMELVVKLHHCYLVSVCSNEKVPLSLCDNERIMTINMCHVSMQDVCIAVCSIHGAVWLSSRCNSLVMFM